MRQSSLLCTLSKVGLLVLSPVFETITTPICIFAPERRGTGDNVPSAAAIVPVNIKFWADDNASFEGLFILFLISGLFCNNSLRYCSLIL